MQAGLPVLVRHTGCGHTVPITVCDHCGEPLTAAGATQHPGPGGRTGPGTRVLGPLLAGGH
ncbi:hypothetical protein BJF78_10940 [Pseudonocardia sp. CNS-139]|nr:hypothetical protein BJF78_10940 [Pseudonocardia sp. CNS-139]